jgi:ABC-type amino acid transport substrate-binding protein
MPYGCVRAAAARLGRDLEIRTVPFAEILPSVKNGTADFAAAAITITEGRTRPHGRRGLRGL